MSPVRLITTSSGSVAGRGAFIQSVTQRLAARTDSVRTSAITPLPPDARQQKLLRFAETLIELMCWDGAIGMQRLLIAEADTFPKLGSRLVMASSEIMEKPVALWLAAKGHKSANAANLVREWINRLTAPARLDRLLGHRQPYPQH